MPSSPRSPDGPITQSPDHRPSPLVTQHSVLVTRHSSGSVLVFAVILLGLLAMLGAAFLVTVRQCSQASSNALAVVEADLAAKSALNHATAALHQMVAANTLVARVEDTAGEVHSIVFCPDRPNASTADGSLTRAFAFSDVDFWQLRYGNYLSARPPFYSAYWYFEAPAGLDDMLHPDISDPLYDAEITERLERLPVLWENPAINPTTRRARFTSDPLSTGGATVLNNNWNVYEEHALRHWVQGSTNDMYFNPLGTNPTELQKRNVIAQQPRVGSVRGDYYGWITDLDSKLYAVPSEWGLDVANIPNYTITLAETEKKITNFDYQGSLLTDKAKLVDHPTVANGLVDLSPPTPPPGVLPDPRMPHYASSEDLTLALSENAMFPVPPSPPALPTDWQLARRDLQLYFTVYKDDDSSVKTYPTAVNINTAPLEVVAAILSQIPAENIGEALGTDRAYAIAKRIMAKRPFLCRMDFEDFLAAQIKGYGGIDVEWVPDLTEIQEYDLDPTADPAPAYASMIYYAIGKRWGPGHPLSDTTSVKNVFQNPELTLAEYLELPAEQVSTPLQCSPYKMTIGGVDYFPHMPLYQRKRFEFFIEDDSNALRDEQSLLSPKEFNNVINSLTHTAYTSTDDQQMQPEGTTGLAPDAIVVSPGLDGKLDTAPAGDDIVVKHLILGLGSTTTPLNDDILDGNMIRPGPDCVLNTPKGPSDVEVIDGIGAGANHVADTFIPRGRPSYYAFVDDASYAERNIWTLAPFVPTGGPQNDPPDLATLQAHELKWARYMRFYYRLASYNITPAPPPLQPKWAWRDADIVDVDGNGVPCGLMSWSCRPEVTAFRRSPGFYQMSFVDWTYAWDWASETPPPGPPQPEQPITYTYGYGPMLAQGDPNEEENQTDSTATRTSGSVIDPVTLTANGDVQWSPQICFRSRFFGIYILARGMVRGWWPDGVEASAPGMHQDSNPANGPTTDPGGQVNLHGLKQDPDDSTRYVPDGSLKVLGERRIEAIYDAFRDQIIWQRSPVSEKRALADP